MYKNSLGSPEAAGGTWKSGGQGRPPLQPVLENRVQVEKPPRCPFHAVGVDAHLGAKSRVLRGCASKLACGRRIDPQETPVLWRFSGESVLVFYFAP